MAMRKAPALWLERRPHINRVDDQIQRFVNTSFGRLRNSATNGLFVWSTLDHLGCRNVDGV